MSVLLALASPGAVLPIVSTVPLFCDVFPRSIPANNPKPDMP